MRIAIMAVSYRCLSCQLESDSSAPTYSEMSHFQSCWTVRYLAAIWQNADAAKCCLCPQHAQAAETATAENYCLAFADGMMGTESQAASVDATSGAMTREVGSICIAMQPGMADANYHKVALHICNKSSTTCCQHARPPSLLAVTGDEKN